MIHIHNYFIHLNPLVKDPLLLPRSCFLLFFLFFFLIEDSLARPQYLLEFSMVGSIQASPDIVLSILLRTCKYPFEVLSSASSSASFSLVLD